jgi:hypothetical protein
MNKVRGRPFQPGNQYGRGRPKGSRNKSTLAAQQLLEQYSEPIMRKCIAQALGGDVRALKMCMERVTPIRRNSLVKVNLPSIESAKDLGAVNQKILAAVKNGKMAPLEGESLVNILDKYHRVLETVELSDRLDQLERIERERDSR